MAAEWEADPAWGIDDTGFPQQGTHWAGVERQYSGRLGKTGNGRIAVSVHPVGEPGNVPLGWRLYWPESWVNDAERRREAGTPAEVVFRKQGELALEIIDQVRCWGLPDRVVLAEAGYGDGTELREQLEKRELSDAVGVMPNTGVWLKPPKLTRVKGTGQGRPPRSLVTGGVARVAESAPPILALRSARRRLAAAYGAPGQVRLEDRAGRSPAQRRARPGSL